MVDNSTHITCSCYIGASVHDATEFLGSALNDDTNKIATVQWATVNSKSVLLSTVYLLNLCMQEKHLTAITKANLLLYSC